MRFEKAILVNATPAEIWQVLADIDGWPTWTASVTSVERDVGGPPTVNSRVLVRQPKLPPTEWTVTDVQPGRSFAWTATGPGVRTVADHVIEPGPEGSTVRLSIEQQGLLGSIIGFLTARLTRRYLSMEAEGLKQRAERSM